MKAPIVRKFFLLIAALLICAYKVRAQGEDNPPGVTGAFNGNVTTGCAYDPYTGNATRSITDIVVPGAVGAYPLAFTRTMNTRASFGGFRFGQGASWSHSYQWEVETNNTSGSCMAPTMPTTWYIGYPGGRYVTFNSAGVPLNANGQPTNTGIGDRLRIPNAFDPDGGSATFELDLTDGGKILWEVSAIRPSSCGEPNIDPNSSVTWTLVAELSQIHDPYGQVTYIDNYLDRRDGTPRVRSITEPAGRVLFLHYNSTLQIDYVQEWASSSGPIGRTVYYNYTTQGSSQFLTSVTYYDGTTAYYTYPTGVIQSCDDPMFTGPMSKIYYEFAGNGAASGFISKERACTFDASHNPIPGADVSTLTIDSGNANHRTETRGDGRTRTFYYDSPPFLTSYTDFVGNPAAQVGHQNGFISSYTDPNGNITATGRNQTTGNVTSITHPTTACDGAATSITYNRPDGIYLSYVADERACQGVCPQDSPPAYYAKIINRDSASHRIISFSNPTDSNHTNTGGESFAYNSFGQVLQHLRANGNYEYFDYDGRGLLQTAWNPSSAANRDSVPAGVGKTSFTYYPVGDVWQDRVATVKDPRGNVTTYYYDLDPGANRSAGRGLVSQIKYPQVSGESEGKSKHFTYDSYGFAISTKDESDKISSFVRDDYHRVTSSSIPDPDPSNPPQPLGLETALYDYTPAETPNSPYSRTANQPTKVTTPEGRVTTSIYDANLRLTDVYRDPSGINANTHFGYDAVGNRTSARDPNQNTTTFHYDARNREDYSITPVISADGQSYQTNFCYDAVGNPTSTTMSDFAAGTKTVISVGTSRTYDAMNRVWQSFDQMDRKTTYVYNAAGTLQSVTDPNLHATSFEYDERDLRKDMTYSGQPILTGWSYDADGNMLTRPTPGGPLQSFAYDERNRRISMRWDNGIDFSDFSYDGVGRMISATNPYSIVTRGYDAAGRLYQETQQLAQVVNAPAMAFGPAPSAVSRKTHGGVGTYDVNLPLSGPAGVECRTSNDGTYSLVIDFSSGRPSDTVVAASSATVSAGIGAAASPITSGKTITVNLSGVSNAQLLVVNLTGVTVSSASQGSSATQTGSLTIPVHILIGDANGDGVVNSADATIARNDSGQTTSGSNFRADANADGAINSADSTIVRGASGSALPASAPGAVTVLYSWDKDGNKVDLQAAADYHYAFHYDQMARLHDIYVWISNDVLSSVATYTYDKASNERSFYNAAIGTTRFSNPDELNRLVERGLNGAQLPSGGNGGGDMGGFQTLQEFDGYDETYTYSPMSRIIQVYRGEDQQSDTFQYNKAGELTQGSYGSRAETISYNLDGGGNRTGSNGKVDNGSWYAYTPDALNQYNPANSLAVTNNPQHQISNYDSVSYTFLNDTFLASAATGTNRYQLGYDALGRRVVSLSNGTPIYYIYDGVQPILEYDQTNGITARNLYGRGIDEIIYRNNYGTEQYFYQNWQGSIVGVLDTNAQVQEYTRYDAFGTPYFYAGQTGTNPVGWATDNNTSQQNNRFLFTGREWVTGNNFYEYRARAYNPALGRFISEDSSGFDAGDTNLFRYCGGDPVNGIDPTGLWQVTVIAGWHVGTLVTFGHNAGQWNFGGYLGAAYGLSGQYNFAESAPQENGVYSGGIISLDVGEGVLGGQLEGYYGENEGYVSASGRLGYASDGVKYNGHTLSNTGGSATFGGAVFVGYGESAYWGSSTASNTSGTSGSGSGDLSGSSGGSAYNYPQMTGAVQGGNFSSVPGEMWLGGGLSHIDPTTGKPVYDPLGTVSGTGPKGSGASGGDPGAFGLGVSPGGSPYISPGLSWDSWAAGGGGGTWIHSFTAPDQGY